MNTQEPVYDRIGKTYDATRKADPEIVQILYENLNPIPHGKYLDIGCGSGNYTCALAEKGLNMTGVDVSKEMLDKARLKNNQIHWIQESVSDLSLPKNYFDGAICTLATHHFPDPDVALKNIFAVMRSGNLVILTAIPEQMRAYWLWEYFPRMMEAGFKTMQSFEAFKSRLEKAGFENIKAQPFLVTNDLKDLFLQSGKYRPEIYLDPIVRAGISSFEKLCTPEELKSGLEKLERDIESGEINQVIKNHESSLGDYLFVVARKKSISESVEK